MMKSATSRFSLAVLLSLVVHGLVIMVWPDNNTNIPKVGGQAMTVSFVVLANKSSQEIQKAQPSIDTAKPEPVKKIPVLTSKTHRVAVATEPVKKISQAKKPESVAVENKPARSTVVNTTVSEKIASVTTPSQSQHTSRQLKSVLRQAFNSHFYYPRLAVRRGWSGEVQLSLRIESDGKLSHMRILKGSGFGLLDEAAMNSLSKIEMLPSAIALLEGNSLDLILPVKYRLL